MKERKESEGIEIPKISSRQLRQVREAIAASPPTPLLKEGSVSKCEVCGGRMVTTNSVEREVATPGRLVVITHLPGAECSSCGSVELDAAALGLIERHSARALVADYETSVTKASGGTLGTYFKQDLARVMRLNKSDSLRWTVLDRDRALVEVDRGHRRHSAPRA
ncbi:MAG: YgiT-type zinc finger protein [Euryarchaeota archaeon]|nr:YgiT-type zinc finger protein [Euryarchaeota archaeon]MDE1837637.1 YgiT-type zinc finger protein [Euryarchaeota archaeon]MDE2045932.1 YgiT-type zinc finger protein [Thermoplasmata archaeon]